MPILALIGTASLVVIVAAVAFVGCYFLLRNNPSKKAKIDSAVEQVKNKLGK